MRARLLLVLTACLSNLLCGCGNKEKAELMLTWNVTAQHPALVRAIERADLASIVAMADFRADQAATLREWAATHGQQVRQTIEADFAKLDPEVPGMVAAADELVRSRANTKSDQDALLQRRLGERKDLVTGDQKPVQMDNLVAPHLPLLEPVVAKLTDRQSLVLLGQWDNLISACAAVLTAPQDADPEDVKARRAALASNLLQARGYGMMPDDAETARADQLVAKVPTALPSAGRAEVECRALVAGLPLKDAAEFRDGVARTLAVLLCQQPAAELLALVK